MGHNNLDGVGPDFGDEEFTEFLNVGTFGEEQHSFNMVVRVTGGDYRNHIKDGDQSNWNNDPQTKVNGHFAQLNMKADHQADFEFCFVGSESRANITLDNFTITVYDLGASPLHANATLPCCPLHPCCRTGTSSPPPPTPDCAYRQLCRCLRAAGRR